VKVDGGKGFAQPNISQGGYTYTMAKSVCQSLDFPFLCTSAHTVVTSTLESHRTASNALEKGFVDPCTEMVTPAIGNYIQNHLHNTLIHLSIYS
jgi:hypothetical protein